MTLKNSLDQSHRILHLIALNIASHFSSNLHRIKVCFSIPKDSLSKNKKCNSSQGKMKLMDGIQTGMGMDLEGRIITKRTLILRLLECSQKKDLKSKTARNLRHCLTQQVYGILWEVTVIAREQVLIVFREEKDQIEQ